MACMHPHTLMYTYMHRAVICCLLHRPTSKSAMELLIKIRKPLFFLLLLLEGTAPFQKARVRMQRRFWTRCQAFWQWACIRPRNVCLSLCLSVAMSCSSAFTFEKGEGGIQFQSRSLVFSFFFMSGSSGCPIRGVKRWRGPIAAHFESYLFP